MGWGRDERRAYEGVLMIQAAEDRKKAGRGWFHYFFGWLIEGDAPFGEKVRLGRWGWMTKRFSVTKAFSGAMAAPMFTECVDVAGE